MDKPFDSSNQNKSHLVDSDEGREVDLIEMQSEINVTVEEDSYEELKSTNDVNESPQMLLLCEENDI